jgi:hypothetical protein
MSVQVISEDHYTIAVVYAPGRYSFTRAKAGTRYVYIIIRTLADPENPDDIKGANAVQDAVKVKQTSAGRFEVPNCDAVSQTKVRGALNVLASLRGDDSGRCSEQKPKLTRSRTLSARPSAGAAAVGDYQVRWFKAVWQSASKAAF